MRKLLIADCNEDFRLALLDALQAHFQVFSCRTGTEALSLLRREAVDVLVLDLMLPEVDGLTLLEQAAAERISPKVLAFDPLLSPYVQESAQRLGICYLIRKPCELSAVVKRIMDISKCAPAPLYPHHHEIHTASLLNTLRFRPNHDGFGYLCKAIPILATDPNQKLTKEIYPVVAKLFDRTPGNVERSIRNAIEVAWANRDPEEWKQYFPDPHRNPTNALFISTMAKQLWLLEE